MPCQQSARYTHYPGHFDRGTYNKTGNNPQNSGDESECLDGFPATTGRATHVSDSSPMPDGAAAEFLNRVDEDTERREPSEGDDNID